MSIQSSPEQKACLVALLRESRLASRFTQMEVAGRLKCSQSDVSKVERGVKSLDVLELRQWSTALRMDFKTFISELDRRLSSIETLPAHWSRSPRAPAKKRTHR